MAVVRYGLGGVMIIGGVVIVILNPGGLGVDGFAMAVGGGLSVLLINFLYRPDIAARNSDFLSYANGNLASQKLLDPKILGDKNIYPDEAMLAKLFVITARDPATQRIINRLWTKVKTGR